MNSLNSVLLEGILIQDPVVREDVKCSFTITTNRRFKVGKEYQEEISNFDIVTSSNLAEACIKNLTKGRGVRVVGRLKEEVMTNDNNITRSRVVIIAEHVEFKPVVVSRTSESQKVC